MPCMRMSLWLPGRLQSSPCMRADRPGKLAHACGSQDDFQPGLDRPYGFARVTPCNGLAMVDFAGGNPRQTDTKYYLRR